MDDLLEIISEPIDESTLADIPPAERTPWQTVIPLWNKNIGKPKAVVKLMEMIVTESRRYHNKMSYFQRKIKLWELKEDSFTFKFAGVTK